MNIEYIDLGNIDYKEAWDFQEEKLDAIIHQKEQGNSHTNYLLFCEHPHVYTLGRSGAQNNLLINDEFLKKINATYYKTNRGGDITYHGPGQIVGYPILDLESVNMGVKMYIHTLEESIIQTLSGYKIEASRLENATGVWLDAGKPSARKICAIGVRVSKAVTMHGFALNVNTDIQYFSYINPCGFIDKGVTSMEKELGRKQDMEEVKSKLKEVILHKFRSKLNE
jgi:lipoyl(octanoyl) transferase